MPSILIIEEKIKWKDFFKSILISGYDLTYWPNGDDIDHILIHKEFDIILLDLQLKIRDSLTLLNEIKQNSPHTPVIIITNINETSLIVNASRQGAYDIIFKSFSDEKIKLSLHRALETTHLKNEIDYLRHEQDVIYDFDKVIAFSPSMKELIETLKKFAKTDGTILITGETGTGKSFLSGVAHFNSIRRDKPFIKINCANIPETLLESELFGHEKGAFTGANKTRIGRLEQARGGTVFLDEIGEINISLQTKLLRFLEEKSFERVGGNKTIHSDVRFIASTNRYLENLISEGRFREDLYYRINVLRLHLPPLRERKDCIEPMANFILNKICRNLKKKVLGFSPEVIEAFKNYSWPGNIRQLANSIERGVILEETDWIHPENFMLPEPIQKPAPPELITPPPETQTLKEHEKEMILNALEDSLWVQAEAAKKLGITPRALNYRIRQYGITHTKWRKNK
ncbi:MAG: sigma-54 dependent transcriptional regulator [Desulfobacterales bacterium]|nr:sigma-54 dependent transcriptional regulator [Desulfobacterales bacterium]MDD4071037.1 sigma-54 dependent transcriptional regulator [Desulfobacterales bacterium]MDD4392433.1 sigma-54 dependent transcriptional regulator [Desulfobacterales bacterium]